MVKNPPANAGDVGWIPELGRFPEEGNGNPLQYSCLGNPMDRGAWQTTVYGGHKRLGHHLVTKQQQYRWEVSLRDRYFFRTIKKAKYQRIDTFELWCWSRHLRVPWTARRSSQSIIKETNPEYSLEGQSLKLKLQYFSHLMWRANSLERTLMLGKIEGKRRRGW